MAFGMRGDANAYQVNRHVFGYVEDSLATFDLSDPPSTAINVQNSLNRVM